MHTLSRHPSIEAQVFAPVARVWQGVQDTVAHTLGLGNAKRAAQVVTVAGMTSLFVAGILGPAAPFVSSIGIFLTGLGVVGIVENDITSRVARSDGRQK